MEATLLGESTSRLICRSQHKNAASFRVNPKILLFLGGNGVKLEAYIQTAKAREGREARSGHVRS